MARTILQMQKSITGREEKIKRHRAQIAKLQQEVGKDKADFR